MNRVVDYVTYGNDGGNMNDDDDDNDEMMNYFRGKSLIIIN